MIIPQKRERKFLFDLSFYYYKKTKFINLNIVTITHFIIIIIVLNVKYCYNFFATNPTITKQIQKIKRTLNPFISVIIHSTNLYLYRVGIAPNPLENL